MNPEFDSKTHPVVEISHATWRYWEPRRLAYNGALGLVALGWLVLTWPHFRPAFNVRALSGLAVLTVLANVCYSAIYLVEVLARFSPVRTVWWRWRGAIWVLGTLFALAVEMYWIADDLPASGGPVAP